MKSMICALLALVLSGCSSVMMKGPFPDSKLTHEDMESLRGTWQLENTVVYLNFTTNGAPRMATVEWKDDRFSLLRHDLHIAKRNELFYISMLSDPVQETTEYLFAACKSRGQELVLWGPDVDFFKSQVETDKLKGTVKEEGRATEVKLSTPPAEILELIATNQAAIDFEEPLIFKKLD